MREELREIAGHKIQVVWKDIRNLHLAVYPPTGRIRLAVPLNTTDDTIRMLIATRWGWIRDHQDELLEQDRETAREYVSGESHYIFGERYLMTVTYRDAVPEVRVNHLQHTVELLVRPGASHAKRKEVFTEYLRAELKSRIPVLLGKWQSITGIPADSWEVKYMRTKWGSCKVTGRHIILNLELSKKTESCIEYIILHELIHQKYRTHSAEFIEALTQYMPDWKDRKIELNRFIGAME